MTEDDMVGWHHGLDGHEFEQALGVGDGQSMGSKRVGQDRTTTHLRACGPQASYFIFQFSCSVLSLFSPMN